MRDDRWPAGTGEMTRRIREHDWAATPLGALEGWPQSLRTAVDIVLAMPGPATILWGPAYVQIHNDAYVAIARERHPALLGLPVAQGWPDAYADVIAPLLAAVQAGQARQLIDFPVAFRAADGTREVRVFDTAWSPLRDETGAVAGALQTLVEVTERHRTETCLRESEARHRLLVGSWAQAVWEVDADGVVVADSPSWRAYTGQTLDEWLGDGWLDAIHPDDRAATRRQWREAIAARAFVDAEFRLRAPDGRWRWTNVRAAPVFDREGRAEKWVGMNVDIEARKCAEAALHASEELRAIALDGGGMGIWRWSLSDRLIWGDARFLALWGYPPCDDAHPLALFTTRMSPEGAAEMEAIVTRAIEAGQEFDGQLEVVSGPTAGSWIRWRGRAEGLGGRMLHGVTFDTTDQKLAEQNSRQNEERQVFLLALSDALREEADPSTIALTSVRRLAAHLHLDRAYVAQVDKAGDRAEIGPEYRRPDLMPVEGSLTLSDFPDAFARTEASTLVLSDALHDPKLSDRDRLGFAALRMGALIVAAARKGERNPIWAMLVATEGPRRWTQPVIAMVEEVAERTWAAIERARAAAALRESEARLGAIFASAPVAIAVMDAQGRMILANGEAEQLFPTRTMPSRDPGRGARWRAFRPDGGLVAPQDYPGNRALSGHPTPLPGMEFLFTDDDGRERWLTVASAPILGDGDAVAGVVSVIGDIDALKRGEAALRATDAALTASEGRLRRLVEGMPQLVWRAGSAGAWTWASPQWTAYTGQTEAESLGAGWRVALHPGDRDGAEAAWLAAADRDQLVMETRLRRASDGAYRWFQTRAVPVRNGDGEVTEWLGTSTDIDDLRRLQQSQEVLVAELQHRTRNLIAVIRGIADDTMEQTGPAPAFQAAFSDRLTALSRVQGLLSRAEVEPITLAAVVRLELDALGAVTADPRITVAGPDVWLRNATVQTLALALHELATNARKYGALSREAGRLAVTWSERAEGGERRLLLDWTETGLDRAIARPEQGAIDGGYGRELIEQALPHALGARTSYVLTATGVHCTIDLPSRPDPRDREAG